MFLQCYESILGNLCFFSLYDFEHCGHADSLYWACSINLSLINRRGLTSADFNTILVY